jgi:Leucine-rich repeat (LRR) protein
MSPRIARAICSVDLSIALMLFASMGCGRADPASSLPAAQAAAVKALHAASAKTEIRDGKVTYVDFYALPDAAAASVHLQELPHVEKLNFSSTNMSDEALANLAGHAELKELGLWGTRVTDNGMVHLAALTKLESLNLNETNVTDAGLEHLKGLASLKKLYLNGSKVSDAGLAHLAGLNQLVWVDAFGTSVTPAGAEKFRQQHPDTEVAAFEAGTEVSAEVEN